MEFINGSKRIKLILAVCLLWFAMPTNAALITLESSSTSALVGEELVVEIWVRDLASSVLSSFDMDVQFDAGLVQFEQTYFGALLGDNINSFQDANLSANSINLAELSLLSEADLEVLQSSSGSRIDFMLAELNFTALAQGLAAFELSVDPLFGGLFDALGNDIPFNLPAQPSQFTVQASPIQVSEPNVIGLMLSLIGIFLVCRKESQISAWRMQK